MGKDWKGTDLGQQPIQTNPKVIEAIQKAEARESQRQWKMGEQVIHIYIYLIEGDVSEARPAPAAAWVDPSPVDTVCRRHSQNGLYPASPTGNVTLP